MQAGEKSEDFWSMCAYLFYKTKSFFSAHPEKQQQQKRKWHKKHTWKKKKSFLKEEPVLRDLFYWHVYDWFYGAMHQKDVPSFFSLSTWNL